MHQNSNIFAALPGRYNGIFMTCRQDNRLFGSTQVKVLQDVAPPASRIRPENTADFSAHDLFDGTGKIPHRHLRV